MSFHISFKHVYNLTDNPQRPQRLLAPLNFRRPVSLGRKVHLKLRNDLINLKKKNNKANPRSTAVKTRLSGQMEDRKAIHGKGSLACSHARKMVITVQRLGEKVDGMKCLGDPRTSQAGGD